jgi:hypothetical protein
MLDHELHGMNDEVHCRWTGQPQAARDDKQ